VYHLDLVAAEDLSALEGSLRVRYTNRQERPLRAVSVFLFPNLIQGAFALRSVSVDGLPVQPGYPRGRHLASVPLPAPLAPGRYQSPRRVRIMTPARMTNRPSEPISSA